MSKRAWFALGLAVGIDAVAALLTVLRRLDIAANKVAKPRRSM